MQIPRSFGTHNGSFHADEVTACSLLLLFNKIDKSLIYRTRDPECLQTCDYVCDVGNEYNPSKKRFDHHQASYQGPLSSAGMILLFLKEMGVIDFHLYDHLNKSLIMGVDAHDNGQVKIEPGITTFSQVVSNFLPIEYDVSSEEMDGAFFQAVDFVTKHLDRLKKRYLYTRACQRIVQEKMLSSNYVLIFENSLPWMENFFELGGDKHPAQFVVMPTGEHWKLRTIPPTLGERMKVRKLLPESWAGLRDDELEKVSGVKGAIFCHKGRFISIWKTKEDAISALHVVLK